MAESHLTLTAEERDYLVVLLEGVLKDKRVEEHRTRAPSYREVILNQERLIASVLEKLGQLVS